MRRKLRKLISYFLTVCLVELSVCCCSANSTNASLSSQYSSIPPIFTKVPILFSSITSQYSQIPTKVTSSLSSPHTITFEPLVPARKVNITALCTLHQTDIKVHNCTSIRYEFAILCIAYRYAIRLANEEIKRNRKGLVFQPHTIACCDNLDSLDASGYEASAPIIRQAPNLCVPISENYDSFDTVHDCQRKKTGSPPTIITGIMPSSLALLEVTVLNDYCIPVLPALSSSDKLDMYNNFIRVAPNDKYQARAILEILNFLEWTAVTIVCDNSIYGNDLLTLLLEYMNTTTKTSESKICVDQIIHITVDGNQDYKSPQEQLERSKAKVLLILMNEYAASVFFERMNAKIPSLLSTFQIIGSDAVMREIFSMPFWPAMSGSITLQMAIDNNGTDEFERYLTNQTIENVANPSNIDDYDILLAQIIAQQNNCSYGNVIGGNQLCYGNETFDTFNASWIFNAIPSVFDSISTISKAFQNLSEKYCSSPQTANYCDMFWKTVTGCTLIDTMKQLQQEHAPRDLEAGYKLYKHNSDPTGRFVTLLEIGEVKFYRNGTSDNNFNASRLLQGINQHKQNSIVSHQHRCQHCQPTETYSVSGCCQQCKGDHNICSSAYAYCADGHCQLCPLGQIFSNASSKRHCIDGTVSSKRLHMTTVFMIWGCSSVGLLVTFTFAVVIILYHKTPIVVVSKKPMLAVICLTTSVYFALPLGTIAEFDFMMCAGFWITNGLAMTVSASATIAKLHMYSQAAKLQEQRFSMATVIATIITMAYVEVIIGVSIMIYKVPSLALVETLIQGVPKYVSVCSWFENSSFFLLLFPMCLLAISLITCLRNNKVSIRFINHEVRNTMICTILQLVATITIGPAITFGIYNTRTQDRFVIFLAFVDILGYLQLVFLLLPTFYLIIFQRHKNSVDWLLGQKLPTVSVANETYVVQISRIKSFVDAVPYPRVVKRRSRLTSQQTVHVDIDNSRKEAKVSFPIFQETNNRFSTESFA